MIKSLPKVVLRAAGMILKLVLRIFRLAAPAVVILVLMVATSLATATIPALFGAASFVAERAAALAPRTVKTVRQAHQAQVRLTSEALIAARRHNDALKLADRRLRASLTSAQTTAMQYRAVATHASRRIATRTAQGAARNLSSMAGEAVPVYGIAVVVAATSLELYDACETMKDVAALEKQLGLGEDATDSTEVCGLRVPTAAQLWEMVTSNWSDIWNSMERTYDGLPSLPTINLGPIIKFFDGLFD